MWLRPIEVSAMAHPRLELWRPGHTELMDKQERWTLVYTHSPHQPLGAQWKNQPGLCYNHVSPSLLTGAGVEAAKDSLGVLPLGPGAGSRDRTQAGWNSRTFFASRNPRSPQGGPRRRVNYHHRSFGSADFFPSTAHLGPISRPSHACVLYHFPKHHHHQDLETMMR